MSNPLTDLIDRRCEELCLNKNDLLKALGYRNMNKGHTWLKALAQGKGLNKIMIHNQKALCDTLEISLATLQDSVDSTWKLLEQAMDAEYARNFVPHALLKTERTVPSQITICAVTGGPKKWLLVQFEKDSDPATYVSQVIRKLPKGVPFFGKLLGFWINYSPENCVEFDLKGEKIRSHPRAARISGETALKV